MLSYLSFTVRRLNMKQHKFDRRKISSANMLRRTTTDQKQRFCTTSLWDTSMKDAMSGAQLHKHRFKDRKKLLELLGELKMKKNNGSLNVPHAVKHKPTSVTHDTAASALPQNNRSSRPMKVYWKRKCNHVYP